MIKPLHRSDDLRQQVSEPAKSCRDYPSGLLQAEAAMTLRQARRLMSSCSKEQCLSPDLTLAAVRSAYAAHKYNLAQSWLFTISCDQRNQEWLHWSLQLALAAQDDDSARIAVHQLIASGAGGGRIYLHAARLAAIAGDLRTAETFLRQLLNDKEPAFVHLARLHLVRLLHKSQRLDEAEELIFAALDDKPQDIAAQRLLEVIQCTRLTMYQQESRQ